MKKLILFTLIALSLFILVGCLQASVRQEVTVSGNVDSMRFLNGNTEIRFHLTEIKERRYKRDITWLKDESLEDSDELPEPQDLAGEAITELEAVVDDLREIVALIEKEAAVEN